MNLIVGICLLAVAVCPYGLLCQNIKYSYDNAGNRVKREIVLPQRNMPDGHVRAKDPVSEKLGKNNIRLPVCRRNECEQPIIVKVPRRQSYKRLKSQTRFMTG